MNGSGLLIPFQQCAGGLRPELREPTLHQPGRMGKILAEFLGADVQGGRRARQNGGQLAHDGIHQARFGWTRKRFRLFDGVMNDLRNAPFVAGPLPLRSTRSPR